MAQPAPLNFDGAAPLSIRQPENIYCDNLEGETPTTILMCYHFVGVDCLVSFSQFCHKRTSNVKHSNQPFAKNGQNS